ncbi:MAG: hypothetical protein A3J28_03790 [Acidobacteria bacterium RIFCSPLOWO2_12_FULL_60_22]|nr:MAG: hypothetical protein A3J28_03790 [Acidobacteria bacterium RIFCSPLOWO2_12_FULL_60_22]
MFRVGIVLALGAVVSVLALGGVETLAFAPAQVAVVVLATVTFWRRGYPSVSRLTGFILCGLLLIPLLQLVPLPRPWVAVISSSRVRLAEAFLVPIGSLPGNLALSVSSYETRLALLKLICYLLVFLLAVEVYWSRGKALGLVGVLVSIGVFEAVYGGVQYLTGWQCIFQEARWVPVTEASGTYVNRNHFAGLLEMVVPFLLAEILFVRWAAGSSRRSAWIDLVVSPLSSRLLLNIGLFALLCIGLVFSRSRMGIIAGAVGVLTVGVIAFLQTRRRSVLLVLLLILSVPGAYSIWIGLNPVIERLEVLGRPGALEEDRLPVWRDTVTLIRDYPVAGTGLGTYRWANQHYQTAKFSGSYEHAHNDYLEFASEIGIPGAVLLFGGLWALVIRVAQRALVLERAQEKILAAGCAGAMTAILMHGITDFNLQIPANAFIFSWMAGTAAALLRQPNRTPLAREANRPESHH